MKLGLIADAHLSPPGTSYSSSHSEYKNSDVMVAYQLALQRCIEEGVDGIALLGDLSQSGDDESLETGVRMAAETNRTVWVVSGDHDCFKRVDAVPEVVRGAGTDNARLATPVGEVVGRGLRIAGFSVTIGNRSYAAGSGGKPDVSSWEDDLVVWLTHFPMISFSEEVSKAGLTYGNNLEDLEEVARPLLERSAPTVVVHGHIHLRNTRVEEKVLQISCQGLVEPSFEIVLLGFEAQGGRMIVRVETIALAPSLSVSLPTFSPWRQEWVFEAGAWWV